METTHHEGWKLWLVKHPVGAFIGVALSLQHAREHFGTKATITEANEATVIELRAQGIERVFLAI